jgi:hypothetical protein
MKLSDFKMMETTSPNGVQVVLDFGKYHLSIVQNELSYGSAQGKYEIGVFAASDGVANDMVELPGITDEDESIKGWLTEVDVDNIIKKLYTITAKEPVQV